MKTKVGKLVDYVNEDGINKTVIEFENLDDLQKGVEGLLTFKGYEDYIFFIHQHLDRTKVGVRSNEISRFRRTSDSIFRNGFDYESYNFATESVGILTSDNLSEYTPKPHNDERELAKGNLKELLVFDTMHYCYEPFLADEKCLTLMAVPKDIEVGEGKKVPFGRDLGDCRLCVREVKSRIPYCEMRYGKCNIGKEFALGSVFFGVDGTNLKPTISINNDFIEKMNSDDKNKVLKSHANDLINFAQLDPKNESEKEMCKKVERKTEESAKEHEHPYKKGSYMYDFDFD